MKSSDEEHPEFAVSFDIVGTKRPKGSACDALEPLKIAELRGRKSNFQFPRKFRN